MNLKTPYVKPFDKLENCENLFFASDFHFGHDNVIKFDKRPFKNVNEMHRTIIDNWNSVTNDDSITYYLGDLSYGKKMGFEYLKSLLQELNGEIRMILGNHDRLDQLINLDRFSDIQTYKRLEIGGDPDMKGNRVIILSHYAHLVWDKHHHESWHLHGHSHQNLTTTPYGRNTYYNRKVIDVGCNGYNYTPLSYQDIKSLMSKKKVETIDHHTER